MAKKPRGAITERGAEWAASRGKSSQWAAGLTDSDIEGLEVIADNTELVLKNLGVAIGRGLEAVGIQAESDAAKITPVDTGRLRNSITHTLDSSEEAVYIGTNVEYARYVHNGTRSRKAQPFLTDAVKQNASKYRKIFEAALRNA